MSDLAQLIIAAVKWDPEHGFSPALPEVERALALGVGGFLVCGGERAAVAALSTHASKGVRIAAVVALRRMGDAGVARFLSDA
ncbi:MAG: hypothetical protein ACLGIK_13420, partial [Gemmatimonadota bacterium]